VNKEQWSMAFDENLAARIRTALARKKGIEEKKMFGASASCAMATCSWESGRHR
jgi:hypothetical protein